MVARSPMQLCALEVLCLDWWGRDSILPSGQKQPATQWSSQTWERWKLEQVSTQGEPHSWCCMLRGHVGAAGRPERQIVSGQFLLTCWMML